MALEFLHPVLSWAHGLPLALPALGFLQPKPDPMPGGPDFAETKVFQPDDTPVVMVQPSDLVPLAKEATLQLVEADLQTIEATLQTLATEATVQTLAKEATTAKEATQEQVLAAIQALGGGINIAKTYPVDLSAPVVNMALALGNFAVLERIKVLSLAGTTATLTIGHGGSDPIPLAAGDVWDGLEITPAMGLTLDSPGGAGGAVEFLFFGR